MMRNVSLIFMTCILVIALSALAQHDHPAAGTTPQAQAKAPMNCEMMMQEMHASSKAMDDRLQQLVDDMNKTKGSAKVDRMAAVLNELVTQRSQMREHMVAMMPKMMSHMTQHMQSGMTSGMPQSMAGCPMMKGAPKAPDTSASEPKP